MSQQHQKARGGGRRTPQGSEDWGGYGPTTSTASAGDRNGQQEEHRRPPSSSQQHRHPPLAPSNKGTALESLNAAGIWALLFTPYLALVLALLIDLRPHYRVATTAPFFGGIAACGKDDGGGPLNTSASSLPTLARYRRLTTGCLRVVNANFSQLHSAPFQIPVQSAFLNLDAQFDPDAVLMPLVSLVPPVADAGSESDDKAPGVRWLRRRLRRTSTSTNATTSTIDAEEQRKKAEERRDSLGLALTARLEVPLADQSGWRVLHQGVPIRHVLDAPDPDDDDDDDDDPSTADSHRLLLSSFAKDDDGGAAAALLPASVRQTPTGFRLLAILFDTPGMERGFPEYRVSITMEGPGADALPPHLGLTLRHDRQAYLWGLALLRALLLALTITGAYLWHSLMWRETRSGGGVCSWLPEQQCIGLVLIPALLLWQDPLSLLLAFVSIPPPALLFLSDLGHTIGYQTMLLAWVAILDGLRLYETPKEVWLRSLLTAPRQQQQQGGTGTATATSSSWEGPSYYGGAAGGGSMMMRPFPPVGDPYLQPRLAPQSTRSEGGGNSQAGGTLWPPKHHPRGEYWGDFAFPKILLFIPSVLVTALLCAVRYPQLFFAPTDAAGAASPTGPGAIVRRVYLIVSLVALALLALWYALVLKAAAQTGRALRRQPYMRTRSQQLSYRFVAQQVFLILVCKLAALVLETAHLGRLVGAHLGDIRSLWRAQLAIDSAQLPLWASSFRPLAGELLFISLTSALTALVFLPAKRWSGSQSDVGGGGYPHVALESELPERQKQWATCAAAPPPPLLKRVDAAGSRANSSKGPPVFCLETACWLMEAAWQSYYDPDGRFHPAPASDAVTPGKMALGNLGLELVAYVHDPATDTHAILARGRHALVLAFRGSLSSKNLLTDLKMKQVPLPDMRLGEKGKRRRRKGETESLLSSRHQPQQQHHGGIFSPGTPQSSRGGCYGATDETLDRLGMAAARIAPRTASTGDLRRLGGEDREDDKEDRYHRRSSAGTPTRPSDPGPGLNNGGSSNHGAAAFVAASPVALPWAGPADQRRGSSNALSSMEGAYPEQRRRRSLSADLGAAEQQQQRRWSRGSFGSSGGFLEKEEAEEEEEEEGQEEGGGGDEEEEALLLQGLFDASTSSTAPSSATAALGCGPSCRRSLARLPALRHTLSHVHAGFWGAYSGVRAQVLVAIKRALDTKYAPVLCTGHSLGGCLSMLAAFDITLNFPRVPHPVQVYTQGSPRLGNPAFASLYDATVPATFRVVVDSDAVPGLPKMLGLYRHCGIEVLVDADSGGNLIVQPSAVEKWLLMRHRTSTGNHSLTAYRDCMEACFDPEDLVLGQDNRTSADDDLPEWLLGSRRSTHFI